MDNTNCSLGLNYFFVSSASKSIELLLPQSTPAVSVVLIYEQDIFDGLLGL
jgi:hypothetical protein